MSQEAPVNPEGDAAFWRGRAERAEKNAWDWGVEMYKTQGREERLWRR